MYLSSLSFESLLRILSYIFCIFPNFLWKRCWELPVHDRVCWLRFNSLIRSRSLRRQSSLKYLLPHILRNNSRQLLFYRCNVFIHLKSFLVNPKLLEFYILYICGENFLHLELKCILLRFLYYYLREVQEPVLIQFN